MASETYWFNTRTGQVETDAAKSRGEDLMGPYDSYEAAAKAFTTARERTERWDAEDRAWDEGETSA